MSKTACILLNYRNPEEILPLIESVEKCEWPEKMIYVVENGTGPEAKTFLENRVGKSNVVSTAVNLGFAGGMNLGLRHALSLGAEFFWILSKDMTVDPQCLKHLHELWPTLERPGLLGSLTDFNGTDQVYFFRAKIDSKGNARHGNKGRTIQEIPELKEAFGETDYVNGSCIFTHRSVLEKIGLIPEEYFLYYEDCEWGVKAQKAGFKNYVSYRSRVHHRRKVGEFNPTAEFYCRRNSYMFKRRNGYERPWTKTLEVMKLRKAWIKALLRNDSKLAEILSAALRGIRSNASGVGQWR